MSVGRSPILGIRCHLAGPNASPVGESEYDYRGDSPLRGTYLINKLKFVVFRLLIHL